MTVTRFIIVVLHFGFEECSKSLPLQNVHFAYSVVTQKCTMAVAGIRHDLPHKRVTIPTRCGNENNWCDKSESDPFTMITVLFIPVGLYHSAV